MRLALFIVAILAVSASVIGQNAMWGVAVILCAPAAFAGLALWYSFVSMTKNWIQALLVGMSLGAVIVLGAAMQEGALAVEARGMFAAAIVGTLILKAIHAYSRRGWLQLR